MSSVRAVPPIDALQGRWRGGWLFASIWLIYLFDPLQHAWLNPSPVARAAGVVGVVGFCALYVWSWVSIRSLRRSGVEVSARRRIAIIGGGWIFGVVAAPGDGESSLAIAVFIAVLAMFALPTRWAIAVVSGLVAAVEISSRVVPGWRPVDQLGFQVFVSALAMWGVGQLVQRNRELAVAHEQIAHLAVSQERGRFARDMHDLLGHSLTVLAVKAELAGRLIRLNPVQAEQEINEVEQLARVALRDVRAAVAGYRETNLASELASARVALDAAGIEAELPSTLDDVPGERRELFSWAVREGVTNIVRHSGASRCRVVVGRDGVELSDDGRGPVEDGPSSGGAGLAGLRERAARVGAVLTIGRSTDGGFLLRVGW